MRVLVCGGAGYIGSHTVVELMARGHEVMVLDNYANASPKVLERIQRITGRRIAYVTSDIRNAGALARLFERERFDAVIHFAALKSVAESWRRPLEYFETNISGSITLFDQMRAAGVKKLVFSSSATVYGAPEICPIPESAPLQVTNPYGRTKLVVEQLIEDLCSADTSFQAAVLRYFNPVGAHPSGLIGEAPQGAPNNLMPYVCQVAVGRRPHLNVFGNDYPTPDGTGVRDYIHVVDLARAHVRAIEHLQDGGNLTVNLGTGRGYSVLEVVAAFERVSGRRVPVSYLPRRAGDVAECYALPDLAHRLLDWRAEHGLERMCEDAWRWQSANPESFG